MCHLCKYLRHIAHGLGHVGCMRMYPSFWFLKVVDDRNHCLNVYWLSSLGLKLSSRRGLVELFPMQWKYKLEGIASFKMPTMLRDTLQHNNIMQEGYRPKMLLYALDKLFYIYDQVKCHRGIDEKILVAYEIISFVALHCTEHRGWLEKSHVPDTMPLVNLNDAQHLEHLTWAVYDGALHVGNCPELLGECQCCTVLAGIFQHIYKGHDKTAHCWPYTLASWDCQQRTEVVCEECRQNITHGRHNGGRRARGQGSRSSFRHHSKSPSQKGWTRFTHGSPSNTPPLRYPSAGNSFPQARTPHPSSPQL